MATYEMSILGHGTHVDDSGDVFPAKFAPGVLTAPIFVYSFLDPVANTFLSGGFVVPKNYVGSAEVVLYWVAASITGNCQWSFIYEAVGAGEDFGNTVGDEIVSAAKVPNGTTNYLNVDTFVPTSANFAADDQVRFNFARLVASDTMVGTANLVSLLFRWDDR